MGMSMPPQKGFCGAFSLKKRPLAPQRPAARMADVKTL